MSRRERHLIVFGRAPQFGAVKRRLASEVGDRAAYDFYRRTLARTFAELTSPLWFSWFAVTPDRFAGRGRIAPPGWREMPQGQGDIGVRMGRALANLPPGPAVLVGSDIPSVEVRHITDAFTALATNDLVLGPAADGGFWLIGVNRAAFGSFSDFRTLFRGVRWSSSHALADLRANIVAHRTVAFAAELFDVDDVATLKAWRGR